jgi:hypothetical protein
MKKYKPLFEAIIFKSKKSDRKIIDTKHSLDQFLNNQRFGNDAGKQELKIKVLTVIDNAIDKIIKDHKDEAQSYGVHSKSTGIGVIVEWRQEGDPKRDDGKNHAVIVTILPIKPLPYFKPKDTKILVEWQIDMLGRQKLTEEGQQVKKQKNYCTHTDINGDDFYVVYWGGRLYDYGPQEITEFIMVD